ncbi:uncharacterized protein LOC119597683 isoform X3 [Penaeus monodon]|uniref:uncharacterized protein LOC119597683 isoform X3 n=1 Tax=Penaeus monodon TaxID=6687 RepID=UPI0018A76E35|nr:uncharacterized protein LOC119597683 isoform X3 [Penaeus monodon]
MIKSTLFVFAVMTPPPLASRSLHLLPILVLVLAVVAPAAGECDFPAEWSGTWFRSGMGQLGPIVITRTSISHTEKCVDVGKNNRYLVREETYDCYKCMVINMKHNNVIQYKESFCDEAPNLRKLCIGITGDAMLYSMFRLSAEPVSCPFHGPLTFTYSKGYGDCTNPVSQVDSCAEDSRLLFRHQACADVPGSESFEEELVCLGSWKDGSNHYLVGKVNHIHANSDEDRYRCFIYEHPHRQGDTATWNLAQSADATCQGLISAHEGSKTMKLTKVTHSGKKCKFPAWLTAHRHWHTLDYSQSYYVYHKNTSLRISNGTAAPEDLETRGHTDLRLVCYKYESHRDHRRSDHHTGDHHKHHRDHREHRSSEHTEDDYVTVVVHVTVGCKSGYQCMRIYRRDDHVVQARVGELAFMAEEACSTHYWSPTSTNLTTLVAAGGPPRSCGTFGRYSVTDPTGTCAGDTRSFTRVTVGCSTGEELQLHARCPEETVNKYQCHGQWVAEGVTYVVASPISRPSGAPRRVCFAYSVASSPSATQGPGDKITLTARHDTCIHRQHDAHFAINATLSGQCTESMPSVSSGVVGGKASGLLLLLVLLLAANRLSLPPAVSRVAAPPSL